MPPFPPLPPPPPPAAPAVTLRPHGPAAAHREWRALGATGSTTIGWFRLELRRAAAQVAPPHRLDGRGGRGHDQGRCSDMASFWPSWWPSCSPPALPRDTPGPRLPRLYPMDYTRVAYILSREQDTRPARGGTSRR